LLERIEAGIALHGSEIKSIRAGQMSLAEAYIRVDGEQAWLEDAHIAPYAFAGIFNHEPRRPRRLLLHKSKYATVEPGTSKRRHDHPLRVYLKEAGQGGNRSRQRQELYDKRETIAKRDANARSNAISTARMTSSKTPD